MNEHDAAGSGNHAGRDAGDDTKMHEGPGAGVGWAGAEGVDQRSAGLGQAREAGEEEVGAARALNDAVLAALERRDLDAAQAAARALAELLGGVDSNR